MKENTPKQEDAGDCQERRGQERGWEEEDNEEQASWEECSRHKWSGPVGLPKRVEEVRRRVV
jgi:hypothetical protein